MNPVRDQVPYQEIREVLCGSLLRPVEVGGFQKVKFDYSLAVIGKAASATYRNQVGCRLAKPDDALRPSPGGPFLFFFQA